MLKLRTLAMAGLLVFAASAAFARDDDDDGDHRGNFGNGNTGTVVGAPGPIAGVGLPILAIAGGYMWIRRQKQKDQR
jgi:hypothetical protein